MEKVKSKSGYHHGDLRQNLLSATRALVEEKGPDNFSVTEACRAAGVSTAAPYRHFSDRHDMLRTLALESLAEMVAGFKEALEGQTPGSLEAIAALGVAYVSYAEANPGLFRMTFATEDESETIDTAGQECYGVLLHQIALHIGEEEINETVMQKGFPLWTFVHGLSFLRIDGKAEFAKMQASVEDIIADATRRLLG